MAMERDNRAPRGRKRRKVCAFCVDKVEQTTSRCGETGRAVRKLGGFSTRISGFGEKNVVFLP